MSRLLIIIKNYIKLMLRSKTMLIITLLGTLLVVAALSSTFKSLLNQAEKDKTFTVGYSMEDDSSYAFVEDYLIEGFEEEGITLTKYNNDSPEELIRDGKVEVFIDFSKDSYSLTGDKQKQIDTRIVQYVLYNVDKAMKGETGKVNIGTAGTLETIETADSTLYYGIVEAIYFLSMCSIFLTLIYINERKGNIGMRFKVSSASGAHAYLGKLISCSVVSWTTQVLLITGLLVMLFDIRLGKPLISISLLTLATVSFCAFGMLFFIIFRNPAASIGLLFSVVWGLGMIGGTFETYMYSSYPESVKRISPFYYLNRSLVELATNGKSDYLIPAFLFMSIILVISVVLGILITSKKKEV